MQHEPRATSYVPWATSLHAQRDAHNLYKLRTIWVMHGSIFGVTTRPLFQRGGFSGASVASQGRHCTTRRGYCTPYPTDCGPMLWHMRRGLHTGINTTSAHRDQTQPTASVSINVYVGVAKYVLCFLGSFVIRPRCSGMCVAPRSHSGLRPVMHRCLWSLHTYQGDS